MVHTAALPIRGRGPELEVIGSLIASLRQGHGGVLVVEGSPGIGKSRLIAEAVALAEKAGVRPLLGQAFEYQQTVPFFALFTATVHANPPIGDAKALRRLGKSTDLQHWVVHDLRSAIRAAAATTPLMILIEDVHWADASTLLALRALTAIPDDSAVLWVLSVRTGTGGLAVWDTLNELARRHAVFLRLSAIGQDGVTDLIEDAVRARADVSLLKLAAKAHGNPFLLTELLGGLNEESRLAVSRGCAVAVGDTLPRRLSANMSQRLDTLSDAAREVVQVSAMLPDLFTASLLARMLERTPAALVSAVEEAVRADLLVEDGDQLRFRHDLLREAARLTLPRSLQRAIERQSVAVMLEMGVAPAEVATQLVRSADVGDKDAVATLREAARSVANSDKSSAADLSRHALELMHADDADRGAVITESVGLLNRSARYQEAEDLAVAMLSQLSPEDEAQARLRTPAAADALEDRIAENRRALQLSHISDVTRARHHAWILCNHAVSGLPPDESIIDTAVAAAEATDDPETRIITGISLAILDYVDGHALRALDRLDNLDLPASGDDPTFGNVLACVHRTNVLSFIGRSEEAQAAVKHGRESAHRDGSDMASALWALKAAELHLAAGRLSAARETLESIASPVWGVTSEMSVNRWMVLAEVAVHTGDQELLERAVAETRAADPNGVTLVCRGAADVQALAAWHCGDMPEVARWLSGDGPPVVNALWPNTFDKLTRTARVAAATGDAGLRARVLRSIDLLEHDKNEVPLFSSVIGYTRGILERDSAALEQAAAALRTDRPLLSASASEDAGFALAHVGSNAAAVEQFSKAFDLYVGSESVADARRVARKLRSLGVVRRVTQSNEKTGWDSLTEAELKIVNLIADGATNAAVAERLCLSPNTVKSHVRNAFTKLGVNSRTQLAGLMRGSAARMAH